MNNASPFYIYISNTPVSKNGTPISSSKSSGGSQQKVSSTKKEGTFISKYIATRVAESAVHSIENAISDSVQSIGYLQGNYVLQSNVEQELAIGKRIANTGVTASASLISGIKDGEISASHIAVAGIDILVSIVNSAIVNYYNAKQNNAIVSSENYTSKQLSIRAGLSSSRDGSRGTEN